MNEFMANMAKPLHIENILAFIPFVVMCMRLAFLSAHFTRVRSGNFPAFDSVDKRDSCPSLHQNVWAFVSSIVVITMFLTIVAYFTLIHQLGTMLRVPNFVVILTLVNPMALLAMASAYFNYRSIELADGFRYLAGVTNFGGNIQFRHGVLLDRTLCCACAFTCAGVSI